jgi:A/G-specific adenine glycosylase
MKKERSGRGIAAAIAGWFEASAREMPWRTRVRDPYVSLVSEFMLQQTQVSRVLEKFGPFVARFPTVQKLAAASEDDVLGLWSGMGYYRRAKNLHAAARVVVERFGGRVPDRVEALLELPGVGRYTAGAIASMVFGKAEPIVDGNVARVLMRIEGKDFAHGSAEGMAWAWERAEGLVAEAGVDRVRVASVNEGLMELGALVCTPKGPRCGECPVKGMCVAAAEERQDEIPRPKARVKKSRVYCEVVVVKDGRGRVLVERRGDDGMWAGLWQAPTWERAKAARAREVADWIGGEVVLRERFEHQTTHREVRFAVWEAEGIGDGKGRVFRSLAQIGKLGISNPQRRALMQIEVSAC